MELKNYATVQFQLLKRHLRRYGKSPDTETLHKIRVEIKKIKAILTLINTGVKRFNAHKNYVPLRNIFRKAGKIREPELIYGLLLRYEIGGIPDSMIPQSIHEASLSKEFQESIPSFINIIEAHEKKIEKNIHKIRQKDIEKFIKKQKEEFNLHLQSKWNRGTLHKARKVAKVIIYLSALTKKTKKDLDPFYDKIQAAIGLWHDKQLLMPIMKENNSPKLGCLRRESSRERNKIKELVSEYCS